MLVLQFIFSAVLSSVLGRRGKREIKLVMTGTWGGGGRAGGSEVILPLLLLYYSVLFVTKHLLLTT